MNWRPLESQLRNWPQRSAKGARVMGTGPFLALSALYRGHSLGTGATKPRRAARSLARLNRNQKQEELTAEYVYPQQCSYGGRAIYAENRLPHGSPSASSAVHHFPWAYPARTANPPSQRRVIVVSPFETSMKRGCPQPQHVPEGLDVGTLGQPPWPGGAAAAGDRRAPGPAAGMPVPVLIRCKNQLQAQNQR